jgi:hypothetical protein
MTDNPVVMETNPRMMMIKSAMFSSFFALLFPELLGKKKFFASRKIYD